jgi:hypothetical protein
LQTVESPFKNIKCYANVHSFFALKGCDFESIERVIPEHRKRLNQQSLAGRREFMKIKTSAGENLISLLVYEGVQLFS